jgi:hypothetical protein
VYDTVLFGVGPNSDNKMIRFDKIGVKTTIYGKIICNDDSWHLDGW